MKSQGARKVKSPMSAVRAKMKKPVSWRKTGWVHPAENLKRVKALLGQLPSGGMIDVEGRKLDAERISADQAIALLEHLRWLNGNMPSERIRLEEATCPEPLSDWLVQHRAQLEQRRTEVHDKIAASVKRVRQMRAKRYRTNEAA